MLGIYRIVAVFCSKLTYTDKNISMTTLQWYNMMMYNSGMDKG
jgi:hypothetical protein